MNNDLPVHAQAENTDPFPPDDYQPMSVSHQIRGAILYRIKTGQPVLPEIDGREESKADVIRTLLSGTHPYLISEEGTGKTRLSKSLTALLPDIPVIKGCPYNDDPAWPHELLCPRCRSVKEPAIEFGTDILPGTRRFSRIQGNEYTNEAKLLGLKDIQQIAQGKSIADPEIFTGTGVFRANRGILFVDEMPAIRTKIQVLFHPILEEKQAVLEEYNWQYPLDLIFVATGNPLGFSHVNDIPRPLLDRLECIYMDMPDEDIEKKIMIEEGFRDFYKSPVSHKAELPQFFTPEDIARKAMTPWWVIDTVNKAVRHSRICRYVEKRPSIRASIRALEHTYSSAELENKRVTSIKHAMQGTRLALRGRIGLRADLIDFDQPVKAFKMIDRLSEDFIWNAFENIVREGPFMGDWDRKVAGKELELMMSDNIGTDEGRISAAMLSDKPVLRDTINRMKKYGLQQENPVIQNGTATDLYNSTDPQISGELDFSALEMIANLLVHEKIISEMRLKKVFFAREYVWDR